MTLNRDLLSPFLLASFVDEDIIEAGDTAAVLFDYDRKHYPAKVIRVDGESRKVTVKFFPKKNFRAANYTSKNYVLPMDRVVKVYPKGESENNIITDLTPSTFDEDASFTVYAILGGREVKRQRGKEVIFLVQYVGYDKLGDMYWVSEDRVGIPGDDPLPELDCSVLDRESYNLKAIQNKLTKTVPGVAEIVYKDELLSDILGSEEIPDRLKRHLIQLKDVPFRLVGENESISNDDAMILLHPGMDIRIPWPFLGEEGGVEEGGVLCRIESYAPFNCSSSDSSICGALQSPPGVLPEMGVANSDSTFPTSKALGTPSIPHAEYTQPMECEDTSTNNDRASTAKALGTMPPIPGAMETQVMEWGDVDNEENGKMPASLEAHGENARGAVVPNGGVQNCMPGMDFLACLTAADVSKDHQIPVSDSNDGGENWRDKIDHTFNFSEVGIKKTASGKFYLDIRDRRVGTFDTLPEAIEASKRMRVELKLKGHIDYVHPNKRTDTRKENYNADERDKEFMRAKKLANPIDYKKLGVYPQKSRSENEGPTNTYYIVRIQTGNEYTWFGSYKSIDMAAFVNERVRDYLDENGRGAKAIEKAKEIAANIETKASLDSGCLLCLETEFPTPGGTKPKTHSVGCPKSRPAIGISRSNKAKAARERMMKDKVNVEQV